MLLADRNDLALWLDDAHGVGVLGETERGIIYSTAMAPPLAAAASRAMTLLQEESWRRTRLKENIACFRQRAASLPLSTWETPIQPIIIGDNAWALEISRHIAEAGFLVRAIRPPTVPDGTARLRITLSAGHLPSASTD